MPKRTGLPPATAVDSFVPVSRPNAIFGTSAWRPRQHAFFPGHVKRYTKSLQRGLWRFKQRFCRDHMHATCRTGGNVPLMGVAQVQHGGGVDVRAVRRKDSVGMTGQDDMGVIRAVHVFPRQVFEVVRHVLEEEYVVVFTSQQ